MQKLSIAILAPLYHSIPPSKRGGTEWIVYHQANGLVERGYEVTLFASANSKSEARLIPVCPRGAGEYKIDLSKVEGSRLLRIEMTFLARMMEELLKRQKEFDLIFNHLRGGEVILPFTHFIKPPVIHVLHTPLFKEIIELYRKYKAPLISISKNQRSPAPHLNWLATVYNGVDLKTFKFNAKKGDYLFYLAHLSEHKNPLEAILAAQGTGLPLILAGKIRDKEYWEEKVKPLTQGKKVKYIGEIGLEEKVKLFRGARAFLFPVKWPEPFGLAMIEAMACGTPVIAYRKGAILEVVRDGKTGFIVQNLKEMTRAIKRIDGIDRRECRKHVEENFSLEKMIDGYEEVCKRVKVWNT